MQVVWPYLMICYVVLIPITTNTSTITTMTSTINTLSTASTNHTTAASLATTDAVSVVHHGVYPPGCMGNEPEPSCSVQC